MDSLPKDPILEYNDDTLTALRKQYNFEKNEEMNAAIDTFQEWLKKQTHFTKKEYPREYIERLIMLNKGSVERAKMHMDKLCTLRTLIPQFFEHCDVRKDCASYMDGSFINVFLPKLTPDHYRIYIARVGNGKFTSSMFMRIYTMSIILSEYTKTHDYFDGIISLVDLRNVNILDILKEVNLIDFHRVVTITMDGYGFRVKGIHFLTTSPTIDVLTKIFKQAFSTKIGNRIHVHRTLESLCEMIPKELLPVEYGGTERPLNEIYEKWLDVLSTKEFVNHMREMNQAKTNESLRLNDTVKDQYMGIAGTFRSLSVD